MGYQDQGAGRQMFDVSSLGIQCASCGTKINDLPFEPIVPFIAAIVIDRAMRTDRSATISDKIKILADPGKPLMFLR